jgi:hypothetical protein
MTRTAVRGRIDQARGTLRTLEGRLRKLDGQLKILQERALKARGDVRVRLGRLERRAAQDLARARTALRQTQDRAADAMESGRRRVEAVLRDLEPAVRRSVAEGRAILRRSVRRVSRRARD